MNYLSLFSGAGGGDLASQHLLKHRCVGYVEIDKYCQAVLAQRIEDGYLDSAPIFGDIKQFIEEGYAEAYQGMVDIITAGFPCQGWSYASRGRSKTKHDIWPEAMEVIRIVGPAQVLLENVSRKPIQRAKMDLENASYSCRSARISAASVGAPHRRPREWLFAHIDGHGKLRCSEYEEVESIQKIPKVDIWEKDISGTLGMVNGVAHRMDRLKAIGKGQVPAVVKVAWEWLRGDL